MATCGHCQREVLWTTGPDGQPLALDKAESYDGADRFTLLHGEGGGRPQAIPITSRGYFAGYKPHAAVCGRGTPS